MAAATPFIRPLSPASILNGIACCIKVPIQMSTSIVPEVRSYQQIAPVRLRKINHIGFGHSAFERKDWTFFEIGRNSLAEATKTEVRLHDKFDARAVQPVDCTWRLTMVGFLRLDGVDGSNAGESCIALMPIAFSRLAASFSFLCLADCRQFYPAHPPHAWRQEKSSPLRNGFYLFPQSSSFLAN